MNLRLQLGTLSVTSVSELLALNGYRALNQRIILSESWRGNMRGGSSHPLNVAANPGNYMDMGSPQKREIKHAKPLAAVATA